MTRILVSGDFQIGAGQTLGRTLVDQDELLARIVDIAEREQTELFLFLGDAFQNRSTNRDQDEVFMRFLVAMSRVCPILLLGGNHDWRGYERASTVGIFREMGVRVALEPGVHRFGKVAVATLPWAALGHLVAASDGGERARTNEEAAAHLVSIAGGLRSQIAQDEIAILAGHWAVTGASLPTGLPVEMLKEPVVEIADLLAQKWDAVVLGHIHKPQVMSQDPLALYVGSPWANDWSEASNPHGVWIMDSAMSPGSGWVAIPDHPFITFEPEVGMDLDALAEGAAAVEDAIVRVQISATPEQARRLDLAALKEALYAAGAHFIAPIQLEIVKPERARIEGLNEDLDELAALELWLDAAGVNGDRADALRERTQSYLGAVR